MDYTKMNPKELVTVLAKRDTVIKYFQAHIKAMEHVFKELKTLPDDIMNNIPTRFPRGAYGPRKSKVKDDDEGSDDDEGRVAEVPARRPKAAVQADKKRKRDEGGSVDALIANAARKEVQKEVIRAKVNLLPQPHADGDEESVQYVPQARAHKAAAPAAPVKPKAKAAAVPQVAAAVAISGKRRAPEPPSDSESSSDSDDSSSDESDAPVPAFKRRSEAAPSALARAPDARPREEPSPPLRMMGGPAAFDKHSMSLDVAPPVSTKADDEDDDDDGSVVARNDARSEVDRTRAMYMTAVEAHARAESMVAAAKATVENCGAAGPSDDAESALKINEKRLAKAHAKLVEYQEVFCDARAKWESITGREDGDSAPLRADGK